MIDSGRTIPNFFVVGVVKGGTTSLYHYLEQHPDIFLPKIKETNHFSGKDINHKNFLVEYARDVAIDLDAYIKSGMTHQVHIAHVDSKLHYKALFSKVNGQSAVGEISNSYMICPHAAESIFEFNPKAKIIVILRNPALRAWSQYLMNLREAKTIKKDFLLEIKYDHERFPRGWGVNHQYLELGRYSEQLKRYIDLFGKNRVLPIFYEQYRMSPALVLQRICQFLEIEDQFQFDFSTESNSASLPRFDRLNQFLIKNGIVKAAKGIVPKSLRRYLLKALYSEKNIPKLSPADRAWLVEWYKYEVTELADLIGKEIFEHWPDYEISEKRQINAL